MTQIPKKLSSGAIEEGIKALTGWSYNGDAEAITKTFQFADFKEAFAFMTRVALLAEEEGHHPEWFNVYNRVDVKMTTHDADGVTQRDLFFAEKMNDYAA